MPTPLPVIPAVYYSSLFGSYLGRRTGSIFTWKATVSATTASADLVRCQVLADALTASWDTTMRPLYPSPVIGWDSRVYGLEFPTNPAALGHTTGNGAGGALVAGAPCAAVIRHSVLRRGRGSQSHSAISPLPKNALSDDGTSVLPGPAGNLTAEFENFVAAVVTATQAAPAPFTVELVQLSKKHASTFPITSSVCETLVGTERSRTARP